MLNRNTPLHGFSRSRIDRVGGTTGNPKNPWEHARADRTQPDGRCGGEVHA
jgi:hypothetical protein